MRTAPHDFERTTTTTTTITAITSSATGATYPSSVRPRATPYFFSLRDLPVITPPATSSPATPPKK